MRTRYSELISSRIARPSALAPLGTLGISTRSFSPLAAYGRSFPQTTGSVAKFGFSSKIEKLGTVNSMTYRIPNSSKTNFATEPGKVPECTYVRYRRKPRPACLPARHGLDGNIHAAHGKGRHIRANRVGSSCETASPILIDLRDGATLQNTAARPSFGKDYRNISTTSDSNVAKKG